MSAPDFELGEDGYPTEASLAWIAEAEPPQWAAALEAVALLWAYPSYVTWRMNGEGRFLELSTGGWSGNEDLIGALHQNHALWISCWESSRRGGHHVFRVPAAKAAAAPAEVAHPMPDRDEPQPVIEPQLEVIAEDDAGEVAP